MLYYDTDSVIYRWKPGQPTIALGDYLGDMTDELKPGDYVTEFASGGPKNYSYETHLGHVCCKVRGFTLNIRGKQQLNFQVMRENMLNEILDPLENGERRNIDVESPFFFTREPSSERLSGPTSQAIRFSLRQACGGPVDLPDVSLRVQTISGRCRHD